MDLKLILYLDDGVCSVESYEPALAVSQIIQVDLASGLIVNKEKSQFDPSQSGTWLGYMKLT